MKIRPVLLEVPSYARILRGEERVRDLSLRGRDAAAMSAMVSGHPVPEFTQDAAERPLPTRGVHWSIAHKPTMVAGVTSVEPVAIDVERIRPREGYQIEAALSSRELDVLGGDPTHAYFCAWVAKEAVLKLNGVGLSRLSRARIVNAWTGGAMVLYDDIEYPVAFDFLSGHVAAVTGRPENVEWRFMPEDTTADLSPPPEIMQNAVFL